MDNIWVKLFLLMREVYIRCIFTFKVRKKIDIILKQINASFYILFLRNYLYYIDIPFSLLFCLDNLF
jgi:hypothetical protein